MKSAQQLKKIGLGVLLVIVCAFLIFQLFADLTRPRKSTNYAFVSAEADNMLNNCYIKFRSIPNAEKSNYKDCNQVFRFFQLPETTIRNRISLEARKLPRPIRYYLIEVKGTNIAKSFLYQTTP